MSTKIAIFGGTFSPPHTAHQKIIAAAQKFLGENCKIIITVANIPPHKNCRENALDRLEMARLAFGKFKNVEVSDYEISSGGQSYTYKTLEHFCAEYNIKSRENLYFLMGGDSLCDFQAWKNPQRIAEIATLLVYPRPRNDIKAGLAALPKNTAAQVLDTEPVEDISSSEIRCACQFGIFPSEIAPEVRNYIQARGLYSEFSPLVQKIKHELSAERFEHTFYVAMRAVSLPWGQNVSFDSKFLAALLHDCAKEKPKSAWAKYNFSNAENAPEAVVHAYLGALVAAQDYGICDPDILNAIKYHTTARAEMSDLEKLIYIADKTEKSRSFDTEELIKATIDQTLLTVIDEIMEYNKKKGRKMSPETAQAKEYYTRKETATNK